jgi:DNA/RNA-binding domain of Phe-tRNA-synthetase-like protein
MQFRHSTELWQDFPQLVAGVLYAEGIDAEADVDAVLAGYTSKAIARVTARHEGELAEIQAWRRAYSQLGLKPTQYRCAAEALLRRLRTEGKLPRIHPLVDLCNAVSAAYAVPVAVFDVGRIAMPLVVRYAEGTEQYLAFSGEVETPAHGEVVFADAEGQAHARRWTNRQSAASAVGPTTSRVLIVAEALHDSAAEDIDSLIGTLAQEVASAWSGELVTRVLYAGRPGFIVA